MISWKNISINAKLNILALVTCGVALLLSSTAFMLNDINLIYSSNKQQLSTLAKVLGANSMAALTFDDPASAKELLASLNLQPTVQYACIYNAQGDVFATYNRNKNTKITIPPHKDLENFKAANKGLDEIRELTRDGEVIGTVYIHSTMDELYGQIFNYIAIVILVMVLSLAASILLSTRLQRIVSTPIKELAQVAQQISSQRDYSLRVSSDTHDEMGTLYHEFNSMLEEIQRRETELQHAHDQLELRVDERTKQLSEANLDLSREVTERIRTEEELQEVHQQLVNTARRAGMAEIATGVLHNVGNVLNSINVSATLVADKLRNSRLIDVQRTLDMMNEHSLDIGNFLSEDAKGKQIPGFLNLVVPRLLTDRTTILEEIHSLTKNIDHIKTIVAMQQSYAGVVGVIESVPLADLIEDALKLNSSSFDKYDISILRDYEDLPNAQIEKQKILQILVNLVTNAKDSLIESQTVPRILKIGLHTKEQNETGKILITFQDNGLGIDKANLTRIFSHGFTTKKHGHGFGLHSSANTAKELGGLLTAQSNGPGYGATFTIELPLKNLAKVSS